MSDDDLQPIKVMADYQCYPLWQQGRGGVLNIDPASLPISADLVARLLRWADVFDQTLNMADPKSSGFATEDDRNDFYVNGAALAHRLAIELADRPVEFYDSRTGLTTFWPNG